MKSSHSILGVLLASAAATAVLQGCKKTPPKAPEDACAALTDARTKLLESAVARFNQREQRIERFLGSLQVARYLDEYARQQGCPSKDEGQGGSEKRGGSDEPPGGAPGDDDKALEDVSGAVDTAAQNALNTAADKLPTDDRDFASCQLRQQTCDSTSTLAKKSRLLDAYLWSNRKTVWDEDNRRGWKQLTDAERQVARKTVAFFLGDDWKLKDEKWRTGPIDALQAAYKLCEDELFIDEPSGSYCSGVLVGEQWVATARHCVKGLETAKIRVVTEYRDIQNTSGKPMPLAFPKAAVYTVSETRMSVDGEDWALVKLDRAVPGEAPIEVDLTQVTSGRGLTLTAVGHPLGLPVKYADGAVVLPVGSAFESALLYRATLDTYGGNSGSPIVDTRTKRLVGILSAGDKDFEYRAVDRCYESKTCREHGDCQGELVQRVDTPSFTGALQVINAKPLVANPPATKPASK